MNEMNERYGNGGKWYLNPENYDDHYLDDPARQQYVLEFYRDTFRHDARKFAMGLQEQDQGLEPTELEMTIRERMRKQKDLHYGQVVPLEEIEQILRMSGCILRFACLCRYMYEDKSEFRSCYLVGQKDEGSHLREIMRNTHSEYLDGPDVKGVEELTPEEAIEHFRAMDKMGLIHTVWTLQTPFIASICNCDPVHCSAQYTTVKGGAHTGTLLMADYVAEVDRDQCVGCRRCKMNCNFGAIEYSPMLKKVQINPERCIGCGVCRSVCAKEAIRLVDRESNPLSAGKYEMRDRQR